MRRWPRNVFYGWRMIAVGSAFRILGGGLHFYGFTVFFLPLSRDMRLTRAATSLAFSLARAEEAFVSPLAGYLIDRLGPRTVMLTAVTMAGVGYMLLSTVDRYFTFLLIYIGVISLCFGAGFMHCPMVLANTWFIRRRALAMSLISASIGVGGATVAPLLSLAVHAWGWRPTALTAGLTFLTLGLPLAMVVRRSPESMGLLPDGDPRPGSSQAKSPPSTSGGAGQRDRDIVLSRAIRTPAFWLLVCATFIRVTGLSTMMVHFVPLMVWKGVEEPRAAILLGIFAFLSLPSHLLLGYLGDRWNKPRLMAVIMLFGTAALLLLLYARHEWMLWLFLPFFTVIEGLFPVTWATVGDIFGRKHFATIRGTMSFFYMWGSAIGPVIAGAIYDRSHTYSPMLWGLVGLFILGALLFLILIAPWTRARAERSFISA